MQVTLESATMAFNPEITVLENMCHKIKAEVNFYFANMGASKSSGRILAIKEAITNYLMSVGIPAAWELLKQYEKTGFPT